MDYAIFVSDQEMFANYGRQELDLGNRTITNGQSFLKFYFKSGALTGFAI
jgi:hypothetical protein